MNFTEIVSKAVPEYYKRVEILQGDGGVGTISKIYFGEGALFTSLKERIDSIDEENLTYKSTLFEGNLKGIEKISNEFKLKASPNGGTIIIKTAHYYTADDFKLDEELMKSGKEKAVGLFNVLEAYVLANNPDICIN
ncbi:Major strawberry allergen Fra a 1-A [Euphorbia peplus]|nr:Major strawberry allergen Fra a 1-A [Euphorbia peplus]